VRICETTTPGLLALSAWLAECGCTHVAMEATGIYWRPVWHVLSQGEFALILANAVQNVPCRKIDVADALWLADLLTHGLIRASFVPDTPTQELRALLRTRKQLIREQASHVQRIQKTLEDAKLKLKLGSVLSQVMGVSGRAILQALIDGQSDPDALLALVQRGVNAPPEKLRAALMGRITDRHRFLLRLHLRQFDALAAMAEIDAEVEGDLDPFRQAVCLLGTIPGVSDLTAQVIVSDIGVDMGRFPTAGHLISWAGLCPRNDESAKKRRFARLRKGATWLEDHPGAMCLGHEPPEGQLSAGAIPATAPPARAQKGHLCRRRLDPDRRLPHAPVRRLLSRPRRRALPPTSPETQASRLARQIAKLGFTCVLTPADAGSVSV
jgi:transposase